MKNKIVIGILLMMPLGIWAQGHGLQVALKGGGTQWMGKDIHSSFNGMGGLDLGYIVRWQVATGTKLGLRSGLGVNFDVSSMSGTFADEYTRIDYMARTINYTTMASVNEQHQHWQLEIPALLAFKTYGVSIDVGPKMMLMLADRYTQTIDNANIDAYFPLYKVHIRNEKPTGQLITPYVASGTQVLPSMAIALSASIGYERVLTWYSQKCEHCVGAQVYMDYNVCNVPFTKQDAFLSVEPITHTRQTPVVTVGSIATTTRLQAINIGVRFYYTIQSVDYSSHDWHRF